MIMVGDILFSDDIAEKHFVCDLNACKGACCVEGDGGAPVLPEEREVLKEIYPKIRHLLRPEGRQAIRDQGEFVADGPDEYATPLVEGKECAYLLFEQGIGKCGIEKAWELGLVPFKKPISCHLYPIREHSHGGFTAMNYHSWKICNPACRLGEQLQVPLYVFLKDALIRRFGEAFYNEIVTVMDAWNADQNR